MRRVFVLGAGFSKAVNHNAPLNDQLLYDIYQLRPRGMTAELRQAEDWFRQFIHAFYHVPETGERDSLPRIEDILSQVDYLVAEERPLSADFTFEHLKAIRNYLVYGIGAVLQKRLGRGTDLGLVREFVQQLDAQDCIISLNYDIILDMILLSRAWGERVDYSLLPRYAFTRASHQPEPYIATSPIKLYKLHGSLNWLHCRRCRSIDVTVDEKGASYIYEALDGHSLSHCPECGIAYEPVLITPTFLKRYDNLYLNELWRDAARRLEKAEQVTFIGYSLADTDVMLRCMFKEALFNNPFQPRIEVVNYADPNREESQAEDKVNQGRYRRLFGQVTYDSGGFEPYVRRGCELER